MPRACLPLLALSLAALGADAWGGARMAGGGFVLARNTVQAGGALSSGGGITLHGSAADRGGVPLVGTAAKVEAGYIPLAAQPGSVTALTALSKSSGTLELAWTAPGRDGFVGRVVSGTYRIDYSSDPAHAFSPSVFRMEFATSVVPGQFSAVTIPGLEPNTTYYARVFLADARKFFAEDSRRSDESTLANPPVDPSFAAVGDNFVTISWLVPAGGAAGFENLASSTAFGSLFPGGLVTSSRTDSGVQLSLTLAGLVPNTTYFFKVASLNWQGQPTFTTVLATVTLPSGAPLPVEALAHIADALRRSVRLTWKTPVFANPGGVLVLVSTSAFTAEVVDGRPFSPGQALGDGSVVKSTTLAEALADGGLALNATYFYHLYTNNVSRAYSVSVSTAIFLDLPPMAPAGLSGVLNADRSRFEFRWSPVASSLDGTLFASSAAPRHFEHTGYEVFRATGFLNPGWVRVATLPATATLYAENLPWPGWTFLYKLESVDAYGRRDTSMVVDTDRNIYVYAADNITRLKVPAEIAGDLLASGNRFGSDILLRAEEAPGDASKGVVRSVRFGGVRIPGNEDAAAFEFSRPKIDVALRYEVSGGNVVPSGVLLSQAPPSATIPAAAAAGGLGMYWDNGARFFKLFGDVDSTNQTVSVVTSRPGTFQIRTLQRTAGVHFDLSQMTNKAITPNGDGRNDRVVFIFDNPRDSAVDGEIFDIRGARVGSMSAGPVKSATTSSLQWDGKANGAPVAGGAYVYQIRAEDKVFNGTVVVIR